MNRTSLGFFAILVPAMLLVACGDSSSGTGGTGGTGAGGTGGAGGAVISTGGSGGSGGTGTTTDTTGGMGGSGGTGGTGGTTTTTPSTGGMGGTGGAASGACLNAADEAVLMDPAVDVQKIVGGCAQMNFGQEPATFDCIQKGTNFSDGCTQCFDDTVHCIIDKCLNDCLADQNSPACTACRATNCDPAFKMCSGLDPQQ